MHKVGLIIAREYLARVRKKSFIVMTFLGPLIFIGVMAMITYLSTTGGEDREVEVLDESGFFTDTFKSEGGEYYTYIGGPLDSAKLRVERNFVDGLIYIPPIADIDQPGEMFYYAPGNPSIQITSKVERLIELRIEDIKLTNSGLDEEVLANLTADVSISSINLSAGGEERKSSSTAATVIGYLAAFLIYLFIFLYGAQCMRGVIEEKTSKIIEVVLSTTKSFSLMMGKVIGIAAVGLTQFVMWVALSFVLVTAGTLIFGLTMDMPREAIPDSDVQEMVFAISGALESLDFGVIGVSFLVYFLGGYLLYGALFAAVGSAVDSDADAQQFMLPITVPLIAAIASLGVILVEPHGSFAFWMSMVPLTSPVAMMIRVPFGVPAWELVLSISLLIGGFIFAIWMASRIYRVGILMHGTKVNYRTLARWIMQRN